MMSCPLLLRMEDQDGDYHHANNKRGREQQRLPPGVVHLSRAATADSIEDLMHSMPSDTHTVSVVGDVRRDYEGTLWLFPTAVKNASFDDVYDLKAALKGLPTTLLTLHITSTFLVDLEDSLKRFPILHELSIQTPVLNICSLPESLQALRLDVYDVDLKEGNKQDCDLVGLLQLRELHIAKHCDFGCPGVLKLPRSLQLLRLNETFNSDIEGVTETLHTVVVHEDYLFMDVFKPRTVRMYS